MHVNLIGSPAFIYFCRSRAVRVDIAYLKLLAFFSQLHKQYNAINCCPCEISSDCGLSN